MHETNIPPPYTCSSLPSLPPSLPPIHSPSHSCQCACSWSWFYWQYSRAAASQRAPAVGPCWPVEEGSLQLTCARRPSPRHPRETDAWQTSDWTWIRIAISAEKNKNFGQLTKLYIPQSNFGPVSDSLSPYSEYSHYLHVLTAVGPESVETTIFYG